MAGTNGKLDAQPVKPGRIIILNGPVSSGKTSMAKVFQEIAPDPYLLLGIDVFYFQIWPDEISMSEAGFSMRLDTEVDPQELVWEAGPIGEQAMVGMHAAIAALSEAGHNIIADHILGYQHWIWQLARRVQHLPAYFVRISCPVPIVMQRNKRRGDRPTGERGLALANWWDRVMNEHNLYDLEIETSNISPESCATLILNHMEQSTPKAFKRIANQADFKHSVSYVEVRR